MEEMTIGSNIGLSEERCYELRGRYFEYLRKSDIDSEVEGLRTIVDGLQWVLSEPDLSNPDRIYLAYFIGVLSVIVDES